MSGSVDNIIKIILDITKIILDEKFKFSVGLFHLSGLVSVIYGIASLLTNEINITFIIYTVYTVAGLILVFLMRHFDVLSLHKEMEDITIPASRRGIAKNRLRKCYFSAFATFLVPTIIVLIRITSNLAHSPAAIHDINVIAMIYYSILMAFGLFISIYCLPIKT